MPYLILENFDKNCFLRKLLVLREARRSVHRGGPWRRQRYFFRPRKRELYFPRTPDTIIVSLYKLVHF